jgi:hypothetical protein
MIFIRPSLIVQQVRYDGSDTRSSTSSESNQKGRAVVFVTLTRTNVYETNLILIY